MESSLPGAPRPARTPAPRGAVRIRVRYCECDPMGVAHHAAYAPWLEIGRTELLRGSGVSYAQLEKAGIHLVVASLECRYRRPVYYDDLVEVQTAVTGGSRVRIDHGYELHLIEDGGRSGRSAQGALTVASTTLVCVGADGGVRPLPDWLTAQAPAGGPIPPARRRR